jgi:hypothetical protein
VDPQAPTGTVSVVIASDHQPQFTIHEAVAWDRLVVEDAALAAVRAADAICFGSLAQRTGEGAAAVRRLVGASRPGILRIFDVNLRPPFVQPEVVRASLELARQPPDWRGRAFGAAGRSCRGGGHRQRWRCLHGGIGPGAIARLASG